MTAYSDKQKKSERNIAIWTEHHAGKSYAEVGRKYGICRDRARRIVKRQEQEKAKLLR